MKLKTQLISHAAFLLLSLHSAAANAGRSEKDSLPQFHLEGDTCTFNFLADQQYVFIEGSIGGIKGKFMFDTGSETSLVINSLYVPKLKGKKIGTGFNGSGEHYDVYQIDTVKNIRAGNILNISYCGPVRYVPERGIQTDLMPDFLGLIGYDFFKGYLFKLDYQHHKLTFYKATEARRKNRDFLGNETVLGVLNFRTASLPNHPIVQVQIGGFPFEGAFDTGQPGTFYPTDSTKSALLNKGVLSVPDKKNVSTLNDLEFPEGIKTKISDLHVRPHDEGNAKNKSMGITAENNMGLGYGFLSLYKTVWDYDAQKIYLLQR